MENLITLELPQELPVSDICKQKNPAFSQDLCLYQYFSLKQTERAAHTAQPALFIKLRPQGLEPWTH